VSVEETVRLLRETQVDLEANPGRVTDLEIVTVSEFCAVDEPGATALVGDQDGAVIPEGGDIMFYGDGGAGKTTLAIDLACHLAAGDDWLSIPVARPCRVLLVENEGPRPLFRKKLRRKLEAWAGSPIDDRIVVLSAPWGRLSFAESDCREKLAAAIRDHEIDVAIVGPVTRSGMNEAGTLQEVRDFMALVNQVRESSGRRIAFVLVHHENKGGQVSGAWEGAGDTLFHVQGQGHGRTRLYVQKARWSSAHHATTLHLVWSDGDGFAVDETPELDDDTIAELIVDAIHHDPGTGWTKVEAKVRGIGNDRKRAVRDGLFRDGRILNVVKQDGVHVALNHCPERSKARLYVAEDPAITHLRREPGAAPAQTEPLWG
jgi:AAA domain